MHACTCTRLFPLALQAAAAAAAAAAAFPSILIRGVHAEACTWALRLPRDIKASEAVMGAWESGLCNAGLHHFVAVGSVGLGARVCSCVLCGSFARQWGLRARTSQLTCSWWVLRLSLGGIA
ncbi:MAG: hypothetical protein J3K34DRAFT_435559 [Monoraphidium minutum]|nr:MAG: hypothetical protein J3K34DRAFT_435559 [Monoraphidium minutum]